MPYLADNVIGSLSNVRHPKRTFPAAPLTAMENDIGDQAAQRLTGDLAQGSRRLWRILEDHAIAGQGFQRSNQGCDHLLVADADA